MQHDELLLAAHVRAIARDMRHSDWIDYIATPDIAPLIKQESQEAYQIQQRWYTEHPIASYIPEAFKGIRDVALQIRELNKE